MFNFNDIVLNFGIFVLLMEENRLYFAFFSTTAGGGIKAMITIEEGIVMGTLPRRALNLVYEWLDLHKNELLENWKRIESNQNLQKIEPLK